MKIINFALFMFVQFVVMASDLAIIGMLGYILCVFKFNIIALLMVILGGGLFFKDNPFMGWRPSNIKRFFNIMYFKE